MFKNKSIFYLSVSFSLSLISLTLSADSSLQQYASQPRWGQASLLLPDNSLLIYGGKVSGTGGYTYTSAPNTDDAISLSLNSSFPTDSPPWQYLSGSMLSTKTSQFISYATLGLLIEPIDSNPGLILSYGGDDHSSSNLSSTDSSWIINLTSYGANSSLTPMLNLEQAPLTWANQPTRRIRHSLSSAYTSNSIRLWILGGQKDDGSSTVLNQLWQYAAPTTSPLQGSWTQCPSAPSSLYDHTSLTILDPDNQVRIYAFGGIGSDQQALSLSNIYRFTPQLTSDTCQGSWETLALHTTLAPSPRRGHSAVSLSSTQILLYGGASANGQSVYDDLWLLDLSSMTWSNLNSADKNGPGSRWGHTMVRSGSNVIVAFGFGALGESHPAPSTLGVFNLVNFQWSNKYSPSSLVNDPQSSMPLNPSNPTNSDAQGTDNWRVPGSKDHIQPVPIPTIPDRPNHSSSRTSTIVGVILGIVGALVIGVTSLVAHQYRKKAQSEREIEANAYQRKAFGPDLNFGNAGDDDDKARLINQQDSLHASSTIPRTQVHNYKTNYPTTGPFKAFVSVGVRARALWSHKSDVIPKQRFDMLADEESEVWVCTDRQSIDGNPSHKSFDRKKALKKYADGFNERVRLPPPPPCPMSEVKQNYDCLITTRGGMRIWNGLDDPADSSSRFGTSTSFLGASLAPWSDDGRGASSISEYGIYDCLGYPSSNKESRRASPSLSSAEQHGPWETSSRHDPFADSYHYKVSHTNEGIEYSSVENYDSPDANNFAINPFDEVEIVREMQPSTSSQSNLSLISSVGNPLLLNTFLPPKPLERQGTWWDRLRYGSDKHPVDLAPGAVHPIRDPTPAPPIPPINRSSVADIPSQSEELYLDQSNYPTDEHGRTKQLTHEDITATNNLTQTSQLSNQTASTVTSSMIEAATSHMVVVQRFRSIDSGISADFSSTDRHSTSSDLSSPPGSIRTTIDEHKSETPPISQSSTESRPLSPRPMGPRTLSPITNHHATLLSMTPSTSKLEQPIMKRPSTFRTQTAGSVGVRAMVEQFEAPCMSKSESKDSHGNLATRRLKVERSLVKKPLLFVANPDK